MSRNSWKNLIGFALIIGFFVIMFLGTKTYPELAKQIQKDTVQILIDHHICTSTCLEPSGDAASAQQHEYVIGSGDSEDAIVTVFKADELGEEVIREIIDLCFNEYKKSNRQITVELLIYKETNTEVGSTFFSGIKPYISIKLQGKK